MKIQQILEAQAFTKDWFNDIENEISSSEHGHSISQMQLEKLMLKTGWKYINSGVYSMVFTKPDKNYIIKINYRTDPGYQTFVNFCKENKSKYLPKILSEDYVTKNGKRFWIYLIEKLETFTMRAEENEGFMWAMNMVDAGYCFDEQQIFDQLDAVINKTNQEEAMQVYIKRKENLEKNIGFLDILFKLADTPGVYLDIGNWTNLMQRKVGEPVITDPFAIF